MYITFNSVHPQSSSKYLQLSIIHNLPMSASSNSVDEDWTTLDETIIEDLEILRYIIKKQREKIHEYHKALAASMEKVINDIYIADGRFEKAPYFILVLVGKAVYREARPLRQNIEVNETHICYLSETKYLKTV